MALIKNNEDFGKDRDGQYVVSLDLAAIICGVTKQTFRNWMKQQNPPPYDADGKCVPLRELGEWMRAEQVLKQGRGGAGFPYLPNVHRLYTGANMPGIPVNESPDTRHKRLQADKLQIELHKEAGQLIPVDQIRESWTRIVTRVRSRMLGIPVKVTPIIAGMTDQHEVQQVISDAVHEALESLADGEPCDNGEMTS